MAARVLRPLRLRRPSRRTPRARIPDRIHEDRWWQQRHLPTRSGRPAIRRGRHADPDPRAHFTARRGPASAGRPAGASPCRGCPRRFDVAIATWWPTVFKLPRLRFRHAAYFIQSIESRFHAVGPGNDLAPLAEMSYLIGLPVITIATWIQSVLAFQHRTPSYLARNGIDKGIFTPDGPALAPSRGGSPSDPDRRPGWKSR